MSRAKERGNSSIFEQSSIDYLQRLEQLVERLGETSSDCLHRATIGGVQPVLESALIDIGNQLSDLHQDGLSLFRKLCELRQERGRLSRERLQVLRKQRIEAGLCSRCGKKPPLNDVLHCLECKKAGLQYQQSHRRQPRSGNAARRRFAAIN